MKPHTTWTPLEISPCQSGVEELYDANFGVKCVIVRYDSDQYGVLRCEGGTDDILFHVNQVWLNETGSWIMFREAYPSVAMALRFPAMKGRMKCNVRKVNAGDYQYQATVIWPDGKAPQDYRSRDWYDDMQRTVSCVRNKVEITSHLSSSSTREAVVQEYISYETGVLRLIDGDMCAVLFSLENMWVEESKEHKPLR